MERVRNVACDSFEYLLLSCNKQLVCVCRGILLYLLIHGKMPFNCNDFREAYRIFSDVKLTIYIKDNLSPGLLLYYFLWRSEELYIYCCGHKLKAMSGSDVRRKICCNFKKCTPHSAKNFTPFESLPCPMQQYVQNAKIFWGSCWTATRGDALLLERQCSILGCWDRAKILGIAQQQ